MSEYFVYMNRIYLMRFRMEILMPYFAGETLDLKHLSVQIKSFSVAQPYNLMTRSLAQA